MEIPERWRNVDIISMSDSEIEEMIEDMREADRSVNLPIPFLPETFNEFLGMFHCQQCGKCCVGGAEGVLLLPDDIERLSKGIKITKRQFKDKYTFVTEGRRLLPFPCPFYDSSS